MLQDLHGLYWKLFKTAQALEIEEKGFDLYESLIDTWKELDEFLLNEYEVIAVRNDKFIFKDGSELMI